MKANMKVQELINLLLGMNPRSEVFWLNGDSGLEALAAAKVQELYNPAAATKTYAQIGGDFVYPAFGGQGERRE